MPVYERTYRAYDGTLRRGFRWAIITRQDLRVLSRFKLVQAFFLLGLLHTLMRVLHIAAYNIAQQDPTNPLAMAVREFQLLAVDAQLFAGFLQWQWFLVLVTLLLAGSGAVSNDIRNHLMDLYFSKPLSWRDYALGRFMTLTALGLALTAAPALFLLLIHLLMEPGWERWAESAWLAGPIVAMSLLYTAPIALVVLAASAALGHQTYAGAAVVILVLLSGVIHGYVSALTSMDGAYTAYYALSTPTAVNYLGEWIFRAPSHGYDVGLLPAWASVLAVCAIAGFVFVRRVRRSEIAP